MSKLNLHKISEAKVIALALIVTLVASLLAIPVYAQAPPGASEVKETELTPIWIFDEGEELQKFVIEDNDLRGYKRGNKPIEITFDDRDIPDGSLSIGEVVVYRILELAFPHLWPADVPNAADLVVTYHHPGKDQKTAFEYIARAFSRGEAQVERAPGVTEQNYELDSYRYILTNKYTDETFETRVLEGVFPDGFFELRTKVETGQATEAEKIEFASQWEDVRENFLTWELDELFEVEEEEAESPPYWQLVFALGLTGVVAVATVYSLLGRRKQQTCH
jgi:hypothetical protein